MRVRVIGSSGTFPTPTNPAAGYVIENGLTRVWCDTGPGTFTALPVSADLIDAVFISHRHPDHCADIFAAYHAWTYVPEPRQGIPMYANSDVLEHLAALLGEPVEKAFAPTFDIREVGDGDHVVEGDLELTVVSMSHSVPSLGSRWVGDGRTLFYTGDTGPGDWTEALDGVHVLMTEASTQGERDENGFTGHLTAFEAGEIARSAGVDRLVLTHIPPYYDKSVSVAEAEERFGKSVALATPGASFDV
jgi:ribonuclease BN (tRNA processing enzyme)